MSRIAEAYTGYSSDVMSRITRPPVRRWKSRTRAWVASSVRLPTNRLTTNRLSGSRATWSQQSPRRVSSGPQFFSLRPTKSHFSSNCTSRVVGGKSHELVVQRAGMLAGPSDVPGHRIGMNPGEPCGLAGPDPFGHVSQNRGHPRGRQSGVEQWGALALGEPGLAGPAPEHPRLVRPITGRHGQVPVVPFPMVGTMGIEATEAAQVVHDGSQSVGANANREAESLTIPPVTRARLRRHHRCFTPGIKNLGPFRSVTRRSAPIRHSASGSESCRVVLTLRSRQLWHRPVSRDDQPPSYAVTPSRRSRRCGRLCSRRVRRAHSHQRRIPPGSRRPARPPARSAV
ncbi:hypothetical protein FTUN_4245 [Frigoriglobus tundricola]|uniref:Uncharacterized protein n=1 Tax=Frigoriglobus tundricola TaxID=2774151 RepID=A0A6M5YTD3_9BACT|nr:hypothetical protein FTUN_4245 [Frigoriglobus tundricola]